jgi:hypothetical protein
VPGDQLSLVVLDFPGPASEVSHTRNALNPGQLQVFGHFTKDRIDQRKGLKKRGH